MRESESIGGEKSFTVSNRHWKGKKISVPGKKEKHKVSSQLRLQVGSLAVKVMDGTTPIETLLLQKLISWESDETSLRVRFNDDSKKGTSTIEFGTTDGSVICAQILEFAKQLATQKKLDRAKKETEQAEKNLVDARRTAEEDERIAIERAKEDAKKAKEEEAAEARKAKERAAQEAGIRAIFVENQEIVYSVKQHFWKGPSRLVNGKKVAEQVTLKVSKSMISICDPGNGTTIEEWLVDTIQIHDIVSWRTFKEKLTIALRKGALDSVPDFEGHVDFGTDQGTVITAVLFKIAEELAKKKKAEKAERKRKEKEEAEIKAREEADKLARQAMQLEDNVTELYLDTLRQFKVNDLLSGPFCAYDGLGSVPSEDDKQAVDGEKIVAECKASSGDASKLTELFTQLTWAKVSDTSDTVLSPAESLIVLEAARSVVETTPHFVASAGTAFVNIIGRRKVSRSIRSRLVNEGCMELALKLLAAHTESELAVRCALMMMMTLLEDGDEAHRLWVNNGGVELVLGLVQQYTPESPYAIHAQTDGPAVLFSNPKFIPTADLLEKACHCLAVTASNSPVARQKIFDAGGIATTIRLVANAKTQSILACSISGVLNALIDSRNLYNEGEVDGAAAIAERTVQMIDHDVVPCIMGALACCMSDLTLGSCASLLLRAMKSERKEQVVQYLFEEDETGHRPVKALLDILARVSATKKCEALSVSMLMFAIGHLANSSTAAREKIVGMGAFNAIMMALNVHKKNRMIQESCLLFIHMLTANLPEDVHMMLPSYMGISAEQVEAEQGDGGATTKYTAIRKAALRTGSDITSESIGSVQSGEVIEVFEHVTNHLGQTRVRILFEGKDAWTSVEARDGTLLFEKVAMDNLDELLANKAENVMKLVFQPLQKFGDDDSTAAAMLYASKTLLSGSALLKTAVCEGPCLGWIVQAMQNHSNHSDVAQGACDTVSELVAGSKRNQKHVRKTKFAEALATVLDLHSDNQSVALSALRSLKAMLTVGEKAGGAFAKQMSEVDGLAVVDAVLKEQQGSNQEILSIGLEIRAKLSKYAPEKKESDPAQARLGAGRRASLSVFAAPPASMKKGQAAGMSGDAIAEGNEEEEEEDDAFALLQDLMSDMFQCKQNHIKKAPKTVQLQIGSMGLTFYDKDMKPLQNLMYMKLNSWTASDKSVELYVSDPDKKDGKKVTIKFDNADDSHKVVQLMEDKATQLATQHKKNRKFKVKQSHLDEVPAAVNLQVTDEAVLLLGEAGKVVQQILLADIEKSEKRSIADGARQKRCLVLTMLEGDEIFLTTDKAEAIARMITEREQESAAKAAGKASKDEKAETSPEQNSSAEEGVPPVGPDASEISQEAHEDGEGKEGGVGGGENVGEEENDDEQEQEEEDDDDDDDEQEHEATDVDDYTVMQDSLRGSRVVELCVKRSGLMLAEGGDSVVYAFANLQSWSAEPGQRCTVQVSAGAGLVTDFTFKTDDAVAICSRLHYYACQVARSSLLAGLPGSTIEAEGIAHAGSDADLVAKLQALQEENQKLADERAKSPRDASTGGDVNAELSAALIATQAELQEVKKKLEAARKAQELRMKNESEGASDVSDRIVEMEQTIATQSKELREATAKAEAATAEITAKMQEDLSKVRAECAGWKRKSEEAAELVKTLTAASSDEGGGGGGAAIVALSAEKEKLAEEVEKLKKNGATVMAKLQETMAEAKSAKSSMEKMKKAREKVPHNISFTILQCFTSCTRITDVRSRMMRPQESALVKRAMGELKNLREQIAEKDKQIKSDAQKAKKMMQMLKDMKQKHTEDMEALKLKLAV